MGNPGAIAFACAFLTGAIFGCIPARKATQPEPIEALARDWKRHEPSGHVTPSSQN